MIGTEFDKFNVRLYALKPAESFPALCTAHEAILINPEFIEGLEHWTKNFMEDCGYFTSQQLVEFMKQVNRHTQIT